MMKRVVRQAVLIAALAIGVASAQQILINGAGATFPYPIYRSGLTNTTRSFRIFRSTTSRSAPAAASGR